MKMMKPFNQTLILSFILMIFMSSCKKEQLITYNTQDNIYFNYYKDVDPSKEQLGSPSDKADYTFAYSNPDVQSILFPIPMAVTGVPKDFDREFSVTVDPASTATSQHFQLPASFKIRAGRVVDTMFVKLNRTADLQNKAVTLILKLNSSKDFITELKYKTVSTATSALDTTQLLSFKLTMSDIFAPGPSWGVVYFGEFSLKKVRLLNEIADMPLNFWSVANGITDTKEQNALASYYATFMSRYLQDQALAGNTIYEDDGVTPMRMGSAYQ